MITSDFAIGDKVQRNPNTPPDAGQYGTVVGFSARGGDERKVVRPRSEGMYFVHVDFDNGRREIGCHPYNLILIQKAEEDFQIDA